MSDMKKILESKAFQTGADLCDEYLVFTPKEAYDKDHCLEWVCVQDIDERGKGVGFVIKITRQDFLQAMDDLLASNSSKLMADVDCREAMIFAIETQQNIVYH